MLPKSDSPHPPTPTLKVATMAEASLVSPRALSYKLKRSLGVHWALDRVHTLYFSGVEWRIAMELTRRGDASGSHCSLASKTGISVILRSLNRLAHIFHPGFLMSCGNNKSLLHARTMWKNDIYCSWTSQLDRNTGWMKELSRTLRYTSWLMSVLQMKGSVLYRK